MAHPFVIIYQINHPAIIISILLSYSNRTMVVLHNKLHFKIPYILLCIYHVFCNAFDFFVYLENGFRKQYLLSMYELPFLKWIIYENSSLIFLSYCFTGASRQLLFLEYFLSSFCSSLYRSSFGGAQHYRDTWYFYHTVRLSAIYVYEIAYHHNFSYATQFILIRHSPF